MNCPLPSSCSSSQSPPNQGSSNCTHRHRDYFWAWRNNFSHAWHTAAPRPGQLLQGMQPSGPQHNPGRQGKGPSTRAAPESHCSGSTRRTHVKPNPIFLQTPSWIEPQLLRLLVDLTKSLRSSPIFLLGYERPSAWPRLTPRAEGRKQKEKRNVRFPEQVQTSPGLSWKLRSRFSEELGQPSAYLLTNTRYLRLKAPGAIHSRSNTHSPNFLCSRTEVCAPLRSMPAAQHAGTAQPDGRPSRPPGAAAAGRRRTGPAEAVHLPWCRGGGLKPARPGWLPAASRPACPRRARWGPGRIAPSHNAPKGNSSRTCRRPRRRARRRAPGRDGSAGPGRGAARKRQLSGPASSAAIQGPEGAWLLFEYLTCLGFAILRFEPELDERAGCEQLCRLSGKSLQLLAGICW